MGADTLGNEGRGPRRQKKMYWWIVIVVAIAAGVGLVLYFSIPILFSPGGGIGAPTDEDQEEQLATGGGKAAGHLYNDVLTQ